MDDKRAETSSDSDFGDSWTIIDKNSFCNRMVDVINNLESDKVYEQFSELSNIRDCALSFQDDSNNDADADSDGISVISEPEEHHTLNPASACTAACKESFTPPGSPKHKSQLNKLQNGQPETRTPKKNKIKFNKPLTPPNTPVDCDAPLVEKTDKKHKKRSYIHNRNDKVSNFLNILVAGTIATAAGLALGHLMGTKSDCSNMSAGVNNDLTYKQLQYENYKLKSELQDLKRESWHLNSRVHNKHISKARQNSTNNDFFFKMSDSLAKGQENKSQLVVDFNNNLVDTDITNKGVFFGPKTYAESIQGSSQKLDNLSASTVNEGEVVHESEDLKEALQPESEQFVFTGVSSQELNNSFDNGMSPKSNKTKYSLSENCTDKQEAMDSDKQKNSKINPNVALHDLGNNNNKTTAKMDIKNNKSDSGKFRKRVNLKDQRSKKCRSVSSGKESGDYENSVLSLDDKPAEKLQEREEKLSINAAEQEQQFDEKNCQKKLKQDRKHKGNLQEKKESIENQNKSNKKSKNPKNAKYSDDKLSQKIKDDIKLNSNNKKNYKKERRSRINIGDEIDSISQTETRQPRMKKINDNGSKNESKNDRRKSDFRQEKKDKYEEWEMKKGYEYYVSTNKGSPAEQSDDEQEKVKHFPSERTILTSSDEPVYTRNKSKCKMEKMKSNNLAKHVDSITDGWAFESLCNDECNNIDGSWFTDLAKHREQQRNKRKGNNWLIERAKSREAKRDQDSWCFDRVKNKQNNTKRQKKSANFRSKL